MLKLIVCLVVLVGCDSYPPWEELREGETAEVYACGGWPAQQVQQIKNGIADINANVRHRNGFPFLAYAGELAGLYGEPGSGAPEGGRCAWWIHQDYPTPEGQAKWDQAQTEGWYGVYDGTAVYAFVNLEPLPIGHKHDVQGLMSHELGHAIGADHIDVGDENWAVMDPPHLAMFIKVPDIVELCGHEVACDDDYSSSAKARLQETARFLSQRQAEETAEVILGGCGAE